MIQIHYYCIILQYTATLFYKENPTHYVDVYFAYFISSLTVTCHLGCVRAFVAGEHQWQRVGECLFVWVLILIRSGSSCLPVAACNYNLRIQACVIITWPYTASLSSRCSVTWGFNLQCPCVQCSSVCNILPLISNSILYLQQCTTSIT